MNENTEDLNTIDKLEKAGFEGPDACLMISLFEYGLAWKKDGDEILFIYGIKTGDKGNYIRFDRRMLTLPCNPEKEWNWIDDWGGVSSYMGAIILAAPIEDIVGSLLPYYGYENVFGSSYWEGFSIQGDDQHDNQQED